MKELVSDSILLEYDIEASRERLFAALTEEVGSWWTHSFKDEGRVLLEARIGGRFYEDWGRNGGALYATVTYIEPPRKLRLSGPMGMSGAVTCSMEFELEERGQATKLRLTHDILGTLGRDTAESYRAGWKELLGTTLKAYVEGRSGRAPMRASGLG